MFTCLWNLIGSKSATDAEQFNDLARATILPPTLRLKKAPRTEWGVWKQAALITFRSICIQFDSWGINPLIATMVILAQSRISAMLRP